MNERNSEQVKSSLSRREGCLVARPFIHSLGFSNIFYSDPIPSLAGVPIKNGVPENINIISFTSPGEEIELSIRESGRTRIFDRSRVFRGQF